MSKMAFRVLAASLLVVASAYGCGWEWLHRIYPIPFYNTSPTVKRSPLLDERPPRRIAILPFTFAQKDDAERRDAVRILRESLYTALSRLRSYEVIDLQEVDRSLAATGITPQALKAHSSEELGQITGADALLYGDIKRTRNVTLYIYSHTVYRGKFRIVDAPTGEQLWSAYLYEGRRAGLFVEALIVDMVDSQSKNKKLPDAYRGVADRMARKLVESIPEPTVAHGASAEDR